ncbi:hypothetical protein NE237_005440 [Protea cynaroides]|uniref:EngB-type G domain-containing protein n=1 Tax=Protea cynaroides TaxID=273540 RepID=A0A9Q0KKT4_9MAGN|nr:hypothetical protein NE237_005440 [Protea cynaroides]
MSEVAGSGYKLNKKVKLAVGKAKSSKNDFKSEDRRRKPRETEIEGPSMNYKNDDAVSPKEKVGGKRSSGSGVKDRRRHLGREGYKGKVDEKLQPQQASLDWKRKRIYADRDASKEGVLHNDIVPSRGSLSRGGPGVKDRRRHLGQEGYKGKIDEKLQLRQASLDWKRKGIRADQDVNDVVSSRKPLSWEGQYLHKNDFAKEKRNTKRESREVEISNGGDSSTTRRKFHKDRVIDGRLKSRSVQLPKDSDSFDVKDSSGGTENRKRSYRVLDSKLQTKGKFEYRQVSTNLDEGVNGLHKKHTKSISNSTENVNQRQNRHQALDKTTKKIMRDRKDLDNESLETNRPRKKRKLGIRIDPHDISNKRLDDGFSVNESIVKTKADPEEETELSKNAQFRAIQPSPSILSFVEDNLLGRRRLIELRRAGYNIELSTPLDNAPFSTSSERERIEESIFRNKLTYFAAAKVSSSFPPAELPEIAFAGRSNVGKSSLLNSLTRQWGVVRTSDKPGHTQTINFFNLGTKLCLVDLPGYGFAYAKEEVKDAWEDLVKEYVSTRVGLKRVCLLIDTKWGMKPRDHELINLMERSQTKYQIVLTKTDTVFPLDVARRAMQIEENLTANKSIVQPVMMVSSKTGAGIQSLRTVLAKVARFVKV